MSERKGRQWRVRREAESCPIHLVLSFLSSFRDSQSITFLLFSLFLFLSFPSLISFFSFSSIFREFFPSQFVLPLSIFDVCIEEDSRWRIPFLFIVTTSRSDFYLSFSFPNSLTRKLSFAPLLELISPLSRSASSLFVLPSVSIVDGMSK